MTTSIGLVEIKSIPEGYVCADAMLKAAPVDLIKASPVCPGKLLVIVSGRVEAVASSLRAGCDAAGESRAAHLAVNGVHDDVAAALGGAVAVPERIASAGVIETRSAVASVEAADVAADAADVELVRLRLAQGIGGKGYVVFAGTVSAVQAALDASLKKLEADGFPAVRGCVLAAPHPALVKSLL